MSAFTDRIVDLCEAELARWNRGAGRDGDDPYCGHVGDYWLVGLGKQYDGRTLFVDPEGWRFRPPWSAAFISYIYRTAGAGTAFHYHEAHAHYIARAIEDAADHTSSAFLGRNPRSYAPKPGDLISAARGRALNYNAFLEAYGPARAPHGQFIAAHSDVVVEVDRAAGGLRTIGGNLGSGAVADRHWPLRLDGTLTNADDLICIIECAL